MELENCGNPKKSEKTEKSHISQKRVRYFLYLILGVFTIFFLIKFFTTLEYELISLSFRQINIGLFIITFAVYIFMNFIRTLRFRDIFEKKASTCTLFMINAKYNLLNHIVPYRLGELSLPVYMEKESKLDFPMDKSFGALIYLRLFDFFLSALLLLIGTLIFYNNLKNPFIYLISGIFLTIVSIFIIIFIIFLEKIPEKICLLEKKFSNVLILKVFLFVNRTAQELLKIKNNFNHFRYLFYSLAIRLLQILISILVFFTLNINFAIHIMILNDLIMAFVDLIPLSLFGNFGYYEYTYSTMLDIENIKVEPYSNYMVAFFRHFYNFVNMFAYYLLTKIQKLFISKNKKSKNKRKMVAIKSP